MLFIKLGLILFSCIPPRLQSGHSNEISGQRCVSKQRISRYSTAKTSFKLTF